MNMLGMKLNHEVQSTFRDIPCPNTPVQDAQNYLGKTLVETMSMRVLSGTSSNRRNLKYENTKTEHTPFKIRAITLSEEKTEDLSDKAKESLVDTSNKSWSNDKLDVLNFSNADVETEEPELNEILKNSMAMNGRFPDLFNEKYHLFPNLTDDTQYAALTNDSEIPEVYKVSTPNHYSESPPHKIHHMMLFSSNLIHLQMLHPRNPKRCNCLMA
ncbi:hypothetical protein TNCV_627181 [Trichonephila clavipes]|nr:hypothetical protein TNCV_627181 [Trichonephila clavipes]